MDGLVFFDALDADTRAALAAAGHARKYPKASLVFSAGDEGHEVLIVRSGAVKVVVSALSGREVILDVLHGGEVLGELSAVDGGPRSATVVTLEPTEVLAVSQREFRRLMTEHADIGATLLTVLAARLRDADRRQLEFGANDAIARVCHRLLELRQRYGRVDPDGRIVIDVPFSQADLANWAGLSREAVVKGLRSLRSLGWIDSDGKQIVMLDERAIADRGA